MAVIQMEVEIAAPPAVCFDLARSVDAHAASAGASGERAVAGVTRGLLNLGDEVTWRGRHFGIIQELRSRITRFDRPRYFRDEMVRFAFRRLCHDHYFEAVSGGTRMRDLFEFTVPWGPIGRVAERAVLVSYLRRFLETRAQVLKRLAESGEAARYLNPE
jgi:ligand-binding SRPBCC domain-containing protein